MAAPQCPRSDAAAPPQHVCAVAMLPASAAPMVPAPLRPLFAETSSLARYFDAERCQCVQIWPVHGPLFLVILSVSLSLALSLFLSLSLSLCFSLYVLGCRRSNV